MQSYPSVTLTSDKTLNIWYCSMLEVHSPVDAASHGTPTVTTASVCTEVGSLLFGRHEGYMYVHVAFTFTSADEKEDAVRPRHDHEVSRVSIT